MKKQTIWLLIVVLVLSISTVLGFFFKSSKREERKNSFGVFKTLNLEKVDRIIINKDFVISHEQNSKTTTKKSVSLDLWTVKDDEFDVILPVDSQKIDNLLETLKTFKVGRLTSKNPSDLSKYSLVLVEDYDKEKNSKTATLVLEDKKSMSLLTLAITTEVPFYALFNKDKAVYTVDNSLVRFFDAEPSFWHDLQLLPKHLTEDSIKTLEIDNESEENNKPFMFVHNSKKKENKTWKNENDINAKIDAEKMSQYITTLLKSKATEFSSFLLDDSMYTGGIHIITDNKNEEYKISLYEFSNKFYAKRDESDYSYSILQQLKDKLFPTAVFFAEKEEVKKEETKKDEVKEEEVDNKNIN